MDNEFCVKKAWELSDLLKKAQLIRRKQLLSSRLQTQDPTKDTLVQI